MATWRTWASVIVTLAVGGPLWGQSYSLVEAPLADKYFAMQLDMTLSGAIRVQKEGRKVTFPQSASAHHEFLERILDIGPDGLPRKSAQFYKTARATIIVNHETASRTLSAEHSLLVEQRSAGQILTFCPAGPLTRPELELTEHLDTQVVTGLLPNKAVAVGATWKVSHPVVQALCNFEGLTAADLVCKLESVKNNEAVVSLSGKVIGIDLGALVKLTVRGNYRFDVKAKRLTHLEWQQKDERDQGPVSPAASAEVTTRLTRTAIEPAKELSDIALISVPEKEPSMLMTQLALVDKEKRYQLLHTREWHVVGMPDDHLVMRLMDRGEFVAQVSITPWTKADPGKHLSAEEFQEAMENTPGWEPVQIVQAGEVPSDDKAKGRWVYRISAMGQLDGVKVMQNFYLVANQDGDQVVLVFTMTPAQAQKIGTRDLALVGSLELPGRKP